MSNRIDRCFARARESGGKVLIPFMTAGDPDPGRTVSLMHALVDGGCDLIELGVPFSDPMADGMTIQRSSFEALQKGVSLKWIFDELDRVRGDIDTPLVMMSYLNPLLAFGYEALAKRAGETGVCAFIVPDLPFEECDELRVALESEGVGLIQLVTPATPGHRLKVLAGVSKGFVYAVTITGITGGDAGLPPDLADYLDKVAASSGLPVCAGFGIRSADDVANVGRHAAGAIVGSALVEVLERGEDPAAFLRTLGGK